MDENKNQQHGTNEENQLAQKYDNFVKEKLKGKIDSYLQTKDLKKSAIIDRMDEIQILYIEMFNIQYNISQISPQKKLLTYKENLNTSKEVYVYAINEQAKSWLNRLSSTLNILTIKASEFNEISARRRDYWILAVSIFISTLIGVFTTWFFDKENDKDLNNKTVEFKRYQDSISNKMSQEYILKVEALKSLHQSKIDNINNNKKDKVFK
jgi:hypothetical protein